MTHEDTISAALRLGQYQSCLLRHSFLLGNGLITKDLPASDLQRLLGHDRGLAGLKADLHKIGSNDSARLIASVIASGRKEMIKEL